MPHPLLPQLGPEPSFTDKLDAIVKLTAFFEFGRRLGVVPNTRTVPADKLVARH